MWNWYSALKCTVSKSATILRVKTFCEVNQKHVKSLQRANPAVVVHSSYICMLGVAWAQTQSVEKLPNLSQTAVKNSQQVKDDCRLKKILFLTAGEWIIIHLTFFCLSGGNNHSSKAVVVCRMSPISHTGPPASVVFVHWASSGNTSAH